MEKEYVPSWEQEASKRGEKRGRQKTYVETISWALEERLNGGSQPYMATIPLLTNSQCKELLSLLFKTTDVEKIKAGFDSHPVKKSSKKQAKN